MTVTPFTGDHEAVGMPPHSHYNSGLGASEAQLLVKKIGDMIIINQSVRIGLEFTNVTYLRDNLKVTNHGLKIAEEKLQEQDIDNVRIARKLSVIRKKIDILESKFLHTRNERAISVVIAIGALTGLGIANLGLHSDLRSKGTM